MYQDIGQLIRQMQEDQSLDRVARNPLAQFGTPAQPFLGATILPEQLQESNSYREEKVAYRSYIANHGTRYSPVQIKGSAMSGYVDVTLYNADIGATLDGKEYDTLLRYLRNKSSMEAMASLISFTDRALVMPLKMRNEKDRWDVLQNAQLVLQGDDGYTETVSYIAPSGHRPTVGGTWSDPTYDPFDDLYAIASMLAAKGLKLKQFYGCRRITNIMAANPKVAARTNRITISGGVIQAQEVRVNLQAINAALAADGLPTMIEYDALYRTQTGTGRYLADTNLVGVCETGREAQLDLGDRLQILPDTLGYVGIGTPQGHSNPGVVTKLIPQTERKPFRVDGESYQTGGVVVTEPEGVICLKGIN